MKHLTEQDLEVWIMMYCPGLVFLFCDIYTSAEWTVLLDWALDACFCSCISDSASGSALLPVLSAVSAAWPIMTVASVKLGFDHPHFYGRSLNFEHLPLCTSCSSFQLVVQHAFLEPSASGSIVKHQGIVTYIINFAACNRVVGYWKVTDDWFTYGGGRWPYSWECVVTSASFQLSVNEVLAGYWPLCVLSM